MRISIDRPLLQRALRQQMNDIDATVVLQADQLKHFKDDTNFFDIEDVIIIDKDVAKNLKGRAEKLRIEMQEEEKKEKWVD